MSTKKKIEFIPKPSDIKKEDGSHVIISSQIELLDKDTNMTVYFPGERKEVVFNINIPNVKVSVTTPHGEVIGTTFSLRRGRYTYTINHPKYKPIESEFLVQDSNVSIDIELELIKYDLIINTVPEIANVELYMNDSWTPYVKPTKVIPGLYRYRVSREGYVTKENMVNVISENVSILVELEEIKQLLRFTTTPDNATVELYLNNSWTMGKEHNVSPGRYRYKVSCNGYETIEDEIEVVKGNPITTKNINLIKAKYNLIFDITPSDARVEVQYNDRWNEGKTHKLSNGTYQFRITKEGYVPIEEGVVINNDNKTIKKTMVKVQRLVTFTTTPGDAKCELEIDGIYKSGKNHNVSPGNYNWRISKLGYKTKTGSIVVEEENVRIEELLEEELYTVTINVSPSNAQVRIKDKSNDWHNLKTMKLTNGIYDYECLLADYVPIKKQFQISSDNLVINETMERIKYNLNITTTPSNATVEVEIDDVWTMGNTHRLVPGVYKYRVSRIGYITKEAQVLIDDNKNINVELERKKYLLTITKNPSDAIFKIQRDSQFVTVHGNTIELPSDVYNWICSKDGYAQKTGSVTINGAPENVNVVLEKARYDITIKTIPLNANAEVQVGSSWISGKTHTLEYGEYNYRVSHDGYMTKIGTIVVDSSKEVVVSLDRNRYTLTIEKTPADAVFKLKEDSVFNTINSPTINLFSGSYEWICSKNNYVEKTGTVQILSGPTTLTIELEPVKYNLTVTTTPEDAILEVKLNGVWTQKLKNIQLPHGEYDIRVSKPGYKTIEDRIILDKNTNKDYSLLTDGISLILVYDEDVEAHVNINDKYYRNVKIIDKIEDDALVEIKGIKQGHAVFYRKFNITETTTVNMEFVQNGNIYILSVDKSTSELFKESAEPKPNFMYAHHSDRGLVVSYQYKTKRLPQYENQLYISRIKDGKLYDDPEPIKLEKNGKKYTLPHYYINNDHTSNGVNNSRRGLLNGYAHRYNKYTMYITKDKKYIYTILLDAETDMNYIDDENLYPKKSGNKEIATKSHIVKIDIEKRTFDILKTYISGDRHPDYDYIFMNNKDKPREHMKCKSQMFMIDMSQDEKYLLFFSNPIEKDITMAYPFDIFSFSSKGALVKRTGEFINSEFLTKLKNIEPSSSSLEHYNEFHYSGVDKYNRIMLYIQTYKSGYHDYDYHGYNILISLDRKTNHIYRSGRYSYRKSSKTMIGELYDTLEAYGNYEDFTFLIGYFNENNRNSQYSDYTTIIGKLKSPPPPSETPPGGTSLIVGDQGVELISNILTYEDQIGLFDDVVMPMYRFHNNTKLNIHYDSNTNIKSYAALYDKSLPRTYPIIKNMNTNRYNIVYVEFDRDGLYLSKVATPYNKNETEFFYIR